MHPGRFLRRGIGQLGRNRQPQPCRVDQHHELRIPVLLTPDIAKDGSPEVHCAVRLLDVYDDGRQMQVAYRFIYVSQAAKTTQRPNN